MATPATQESGSAVISTTTQDDNRTPAEGEEGGATAVEANVDLARTVSSSVVKVKSEEADEKLSVAAAATDAADVGATTVTLRFMRPPADAAPHTTPPLASGKQFEVAFCAACLRALRF